jgi:hypothetical protein
MRNAGRVNANLRPARAGAAPVRPTIVHTLRVAKLGARAIIGARAGSLHEHIGVSTAPVRCRVLAPRIVRPQPGDHVQSTAARRGHPCPSPPREPRKAPTAGTLRRAMPCLFAVSAGHGSRKQRGTKKSQRDSVLDRSTPATRHHASSAVIEAPRLAKNCSLVSGSLSQPGWCSLAGLSRPTDVHAAPAERLHLLHNRL